MTLPHHYLADLPTHAPLTPALVREACLALKRNRAHHLVPRRTASLVQTLAALAHDWLQAENPFRRLALEQGPAATGFSAPTLAAGLDAFFAQITPETLHALLVQDLGHAERLDTFGVTGNESYRCRQAIARGPELLFHVAAGNLPVPALSSLVLGLLTRSAQFVKCASGQSLLPRLFAHSLYEIEPKLGACLELAEWPGGATGIEDAVLAECDCVTATGTDETLRQIQSRVPAHARFLGYGHRVSFGYVTREMLARPCLRDVVAHAAEDVAAWDQLGCLSPHVIYVEQGGPVAPKEFAVLLAAALDQIENVRPRGPVPPEVAAAIASRRSFYEVRAAHDETTTVSRAAETTAWTVVCEEDARLHPSCLHRFIFVKAVAHLTEALSGANTVRGQVSTVGLAAPPGRGEVLARELAQWGVPRVCPLGQMQNPPLAWRHDGRPALGDLVLWTDWES
jgi:hypothetical protein